MMRFLLRSISLFAFAAAFVALIVDGTRSIAASHLAFTNIDTLIDTAFPGRVTHARMWAEQIHPLLWDPLLLHVLKTPALLAFFALGSACAIAGRPPAGLIGTSSRA